MSATGGFLEQLAIEYQELGDERLLRSAATASEDVVALAEKLAGRSSR